MDYICRVTALPEAFGPPAVRRSPTYAASGVIGGSLTCSSRQSRSKEQIVQIRSAVDDCMSAQSATQHRAHSLDTQNVHYKQDKPAYIPRVSYL